MANRFLSNIKINDAYTFPASDGSNGQVIVTDGAGNLTFANPATSSSASIIYRDNFTGDGSTTVFYLQNSLSDEDQTQIYIDGVYQEKGTYSLSNNAITFTTAPPNGDSVEVISISGINVGPTTIYQDNFTGDGATTDFTLAQAVNDEVKTMVYFNGVYQFKGTYSLNGTLMSFDTAPANGVAIEVISIASAAAADYNQKMLFYGKASEAISKGDAIMLGGQQGDHFLLAKATQAAIAANHEYFLGLASQDLAQGEFGYVTEFGKIIEIDTSGYTAGDILWFDAGGSTAGALTTTEPAPPLVKIQVAAVIRSHANEGVLFIRPTWYHELNELHDVNVTSIADRDLLVWNSTDGYWQNSKLVDTLTGNTFTATTLAGTLSTAAQPNVTSVGTLSSLAVSGNLVVDTNTLYVDASSNEVGIGTDSLIRRLNIDGGSISTDTPTVRISSTDSSGTNKFGIEFYSNNGADVRGKVLADNNGRVYIDDNGGGGVVLQANGGSGNVGIGITSPDRLLTISDGSGGGNPTDSRTKLYIDANTEAYIGINSPSDSFNGIRLAAGGTNKAFFELYDNAAQGQQVKVGSIAAIPLNLATGNSTKMTITSDGDVGIGDPTPNFVTSGRKVLELNGTSEALMSFAINGAWQYYIQTTSTGIFHSSGGKNFVIDTGNSNVGIGATSPFSKLTVSRPGINEGTISFDDQANNAHLTLAGTDSLVRLQSGTYNNGNYGGWIQASYDNGGVDYGIVPLILNPQGGNVGIGTNSPGTKLEVYGTGNTIRLDSAADQGKTILFRNVGTATAEVKTDGHLKLWAEDPNRNIYFDTSGGTKMTILSGGNVGIGISSPSARLDIASNAGANDEKLQRWTYYAPDPTAFYLELKQTVTPGVVAYNFSMVNASTAYNDVLVLDRGNVGIGTTLPGAKLHVRGTTKIQNSSGTDSGFQTVTGNKTALGSGVGVDVAYVGYTHAIQVYVMVRETSGNVATAMGQIVTAYGASNGGTDNQQAIGNVTNVGISYVNSGGAQNYVLRITPSYTAGDPIIHYTITGISDDTMYSL